MRNLILSLLLICLNCACVRPRYPQAMVGQKAQTDIPSLIEIPIQKESSRPIRILQKTGFVVGYSEELCIPLWSAWQLTRDELNGRVAKENFGADPEVKVQADNMDYKGSGWSRGHMAPAADMKWSPDAMRDCCMMTNICPQKAELNSGSWNRLEEKCRNTYAAKYGAVYIACGPILSENPSRIGIHNVAVPEGFFKVLLIKADTGWQAVGFVYANDEGPHGMQQAACTVDEVEQLTGLDFFSMLPDEIEDTIESDFNWSYWK